MFYRFLVILLEISDRGIIYMEWTDEVNEK